MTTPRTYDKKTIRLHWTSAAIIIGLWVVGQTIDFYPKGDPRIFMRSLHITFGVALALLLVARFRWRFGGGVKLPQALPGVFGKLATGTHHFLYLLMAAVVIAGLAAVWTRGDNIFNLFQVPAFDPGNKQLRKNVLEWHGLLANSLLIVAALHGLIAIWHHIAIKDDVLKRMLPML
jgi:cytochrome b561